MEQFMPTKMCKECITKLSRAFSFQKQCWEADKILRTDEEPDIKPNTELQYIKEELNDNNEDILEINPLDDNESMLKCEDDQDYIESVADYEEYESIKAETEFEGSLDNDAIEPNNITIERLDEEYLELNSDEIYEIETIDDTASINDDKPPIAEKKRKGNFSKWNDPNYTVMCNYCGVMLTSRNQYINHTRNKHSPSAYKNRKRDPQPCPVCKKICRDKWALKDHLRIHDDTPASLPCDICGKLCKTKHQLIAHHKIHFEKPLKCQICGLAKINQTDLDTHMRFHTGERPYKCSICEKAFITSSHLRSHERTHSTQRFECEICSRDFKSKQILKKHLITHDPDKFYKCYFCDKTFPSIKLRKGHMKITHPEYKQIACEICNKKFDKEATYETHMRMNHLELQILEES